MYPPLNIAMLNFLHVFFFGATFPFGYIYIYVVCHFVGDGPPKMVVFLAVSHLQPQQLCTNSKKTDPEYSLPGFLAFWHFLGSDHLER